MGSGPSEGFRDPVASFALMGKTDASNASNTLGLQVHKFVDLQSTHDNCPYAFHFGYRGHCVGFFGGLGECLYIVFSLGYLELRGSGSRVSIGRKR